MFWFFPPGTSQQEALAALTVQTQGVTTSGVQESQDDLFREWQQQMDEYNRVHHSHFEGSPKNAFWVVVALPGDEFSENLEWHPTLPMLIPASGTGKMVGIAQDRVALEKMMVEDAKNVHLTYRIKLQGPHSWRKFLELMAEHGMMEKES